MTNLNAMTMVLLMAAAALAAPACGPTVAIDPASIQFDEDAWQIAFNVILTGLGSGSDGFRDSGDFLVDNVVGIDIGVRFGGPASDRVVLDNVLIQRRAEEWAALVAAGPSPRPYLFEDFGAASVEGLVTTLSSIVSTADGLVLTQSIFDEMVVHGTPPPFPPPVIGSIGVRPAVDTVVARFVVWWDGTEVTPVNWLSIHLQAGSELPDPKFLTNAVANGPIYANVDNNDLVVTPEPATMSLVGLGLSVIFVRKRRATRRGR